MDDYKIVHLSHRSIQTEWGLKPFTDLSLEVGGEVYGARIHGWLGRFDVERYARNTLRSLRKEIGI
jgi:hypothetical protein